MEKEEQSVQQIEEQEQKLEQEQEQELEQEQEQEEATLLRRKSSRTGNDSKIIEIDSVNGVIENNGSLITENGAQNQDSAHEIEDRINELYGFHENEPEEKTGEEKLENLVFYDRDEGIWKCRICSWKYRNRSVYVDHIQNHKGQFHFKTLNYQTEGVNFALEFSGEEKIEKDNGDHKPNILSHDLKISSEIQKEYLEDKISSSQEKHTSSKEIETEDDVDLINKDELEVTEFDVEKVITKQTTHDLYCPNCNSCITKRVILRKRKHRSRVSEEEFKRNKIEATVDHVQASSDQVNGVGTRVLTVEDEEDHGRKPYLFRCLSCFSFFIPSGDGFKLFRIFGDKSGKENVQDERVSSSVKKNWFTSMFAPNKHEKATEPGSNLKTKVRISNIGISGQPLLVQEEAHLIPSTSHGILSVSRNNNAAQEPAINGKLLNDAGDIFNKTTEKIDGSVGNIYQRGSERLMESKFGKEANVDCENYVALTTPLNMTQVANGELTDGSFSFSPGGLKFMNSSNNGSSTLENSKEAEISNQTLQLSDAELTESEDTEGKLSISVGIPSEDQHVGAYIVTESVENINTTFTSSDTGDFYPSEVSQQIITTSKYEVHTGETLKVDNFSSVTGFSVAQGKDTVITIESRPGPAESSQSLQGTGSSSALQSGVHIISRERSEVRNEIEVIKSIVYGGLAESITSLSVVLSAAGGGAATLNILTLGMANLFGGFLIICYNLWELHCDRAESQFSNQISNQVTEQRDRYKELLGRRENFVLHAVVAIISYIIFGLLPPVVYGFSFRTGNDKELKLVTVAASSLLCILILALCRAYVCKPPKPYLKSVLTFVILGIMVSGVSYAGGILVERLLEKLRLFEPVSSPNKLLVPGITRLDSGWASY